MLESHLYGFPKNNSGNEAPFCSVPAEGVNDFGVDNSGNLIVPEGMDGIIVWTGPECAGRFMPPQKRSPTRLAKLPTLPPSTRLTATLPLPIFSVKSGPGSVSICTVASGTCSTNLTNPNMSLVAGVAINTAGDCWANALNAYEVAVLIYFAGCTGSGQLATGFTNASYGGIDIDRYGNLVTTSLYGPSARYRALSTCTRAAIPHARYAAPRPLPAESIYGHVGKVTQRYVTTDLLYADVEIYQYRATTGLSLNYSFTGGLPCATDHCEAAAYDPSSTK